jgi:hypothetical protein
VGSAGSRDLEDLEKFNLYAREGNHGEVYFW